MTCPVGMPEWNSKGWDPTAWFKKRGNLAWFACSHPHRYAWDAHLGENFSPRGSFEMRVVKGDGDAWLEPVL